MIFRRRSKGDPSEATDFDELEPAEPETVEPPARTSGPYDAAEVDLDADASDRVDLGSLVVPVSPDVELRLQVDEPSGQVMSVLLVTPDSGLELRPFAAPRSAEIWDDVRREIAAEAARRGGTASEQDGQFGTELLVRLPVTGPDGRAGTQPSRMVGVDGPRWLLRGTFMGRAAVEPSPDGVLERAFSEVVVVRGTGPMAPRDPLPLSLPGGAQLPEDPAAD